MTTQNPIAFDFVAETMGHCFLCSNKISPSSHSHHKKLKSELASSPPMSSVYSLHCLSRHLSLNMRKVFTGEGPIPTSLMERLAKSRLKAELCEECASLTGIFSKQLRQLEKIQMEMTSSLSLIHQKLEKAVRGSGGMTNNFKDDWIAKLEVTEALRMEVIQKCSHKLKLSVLHPVTKLQRLTGKQVKEEKWRIKLNSLKVESRTSIQCSESNHDDEDNGSPISNEDGMDYLDEQGPSLHTPVVEEESYAISIGTLKQEAIATSQHLEEPIIEPWTNLSAEQFSDANNQTKRASSSVDAGKAKPTAKTSVGDLSQTLPPAIKVIGNSGIGQPKISLNSKSGKYKCGICSKEFGSKHGCIFHHESVHLKVRYQCGLCNKEFSSQKPSYERHYRSVHLGVRYKCGKCSKTFTDKDNLIQHQNSVHLGRQLKCNYCEKMFSSLSVRYRHMRNNCSNRPNAATHATANDD